MEILDKAQKDSLTGCYAKDAILTFLEKLSAECAAYSKPYSVLLIDVDRFKTFNDKYGHIFGDEALKYFSSSLRLNLEGEEYAIFRFGGDEFVVVFPGINAKEVYKLAINIEWNIKKRPLLYRGREYPMSFSGGIASCPADGTDAQDVLERADKAMYFSKKHGKGRITRYRAIWFEFSKHLIMSASVVALVIFISLPYIYNTTARKIHDEPKGFTTGISPGKPAARATVYLNTGNQISGTIIKENSDEIGLKIDIGTGEGSVIFRKSDIKSIKRY